LLLLRSFILNSLREYVRHVSIRDVVSAIEMFPEHGWIRDFRSKYGLLPTD
jgi:hypothetical protein